jgi:hypothetical protein
LTSAQIFCQQDVIATANGHNISLAEDGRPGSPNVITTVQNKVFNWNSLTTDGIDIEANYTFDLQDYDIPGAFNARSLVTHVSKFIVDTGVPGTLRNVEFAGAVAFGNSSSSYGANFNILNWKLLETQSYQTDAWGINLTERWYSGGVFAVRNAIVCAPGSCPASSIQSPTYNFDKVDSILYLDVGANWNASDRTQLYAKIDNIVNTAPPDTGGQNANNTLYDVVGRMYRVGVRFTN